MNPQQAADNPWAIEIRGLTKSYGDFPALKGIDLKVRYGEVFGFLGPNGAGKTTTIRCLLDAIRPSGGTIRVLSIDPQADPVAVRRRVGYLPGELSLDDNLTARQVLRLFDDMRGGAVDWEYALSLAERLQLNLDKPIKNFSKGNKQKVGVIQAFMHQPELLLLDEPTAGLDPLMQHEVLKLVREAHARKATVFFSSHILSEVEAVAERVGIVRQGELVEITGTESLTKRSFRYVNVKLADGASDAALSGIDGVEVLSRKGDGYVRLLVRCPTDRLVKALAALSLEDLEIERPSLDEIFLAYYEGTSDISVRIEADGQGDAGGQSAATGQSGDPRMRATFLYTLRRLRGSLLGWGLSLLVLGFLMSRTYSMVEQQGEEIQSLLENMPGMLGFFGTESFITPQSYLHVRFFSLIPIVLGVFAAAAGSGLLVQDEETGRLDLLLAYPISRRGLFFARLAALVVVILGILALGWVGLAIGMVAVEMKLSPLVPLWGFLNLFSIVLLTAALGLLLSLVLSSRRQAGMAAGLVIVASFFLTGFARLDEGLLPLAKMLPLYYYQGGEAMNEFDGVRFAGLMAASAVCVGLGYLCFERRDIRVAGEGTIPWKKYAIGAAVALVLGGVVWAASLRSTTYESPEQAFDAAATALEKEQWDTFAACLTPDAKKDWTAAMVIFGSALELQRDTLAPEKLFQTRESVSIGQMQAMFAMLGKFKMAMKHVDKERLKEHATLIRGTLAIALLTKGDLTLTEQHRQLAELVDDPDQFLVKALRAWSTAHEYQGWTLSAVSTDGDTASGVLTLPGGTRNVTFEKTSGNWHIGLPFLTGERREAAGKPGAVAP